MTVRQLRAIKRNSEPTVHVVREYENGNELREIPFWMCDPAACAVMKLAEEPRVDVEHLRMLRA